MKRSRILLIGAGVVLGGLLYMRVSQFDRLASKAATAAVSTEEWDLLKQHPDDARVIAAAAVELRAAAALSECDAVGRLALTAGPVLDKHPTTDDESLSAVGKMLATCNDRRSAKWTKRPPEDLVKMLRKDIVAGSAQPKNLLAEALIELGPRVSQELVDVIVSTVRPDGSVGETLIATGLQENNEKLVGPRENVIRRPARTDDRVAQAVRAWLGSMKENGPSELDARALSRAAAWAPVIHIDEAAAQALAKSLEKHEAAQALCKTLVQHPNDAEMLKKSGSSPKLEECIAPALKMKSALDLFNATAAAATQFEDEKGEAARLKRDAWEEEQADAIVKLGEPAAAAAREGLKANARTVRRVSARALAKINRPGYSATIAERMHAHTATPDDAKLALEIVSRGTFDPGPVLAAYYLGDIDVVKRATALLKREKPELWVTALFADLSVVSASTPSVLKGFADALEQTPGAASLVATVLDASLARAGRAENVFWPTKMLALHALKVKGTAASVAVVEKFTSDKTTYPVIKLRNESFTGEIVEESRTNKAIGELATEALAQMKGR